MVRVKIHKRARVSVHLITRCSDRSGKVQSARQTGGIVGRECDRQQSTCCWANTHNVYCRGDVQRQGRHYANGIQSGIPVTLILSKRARAHTSPNAKSHVVAHVVHHVVVWRVCEIVESAILKHNYLSISTRPRTRNSNRRTAHRTYMFVWLIMSNTCATSEMKKKWLNSFARGKSVGDYRRVLN